MSDSKIIAHRGASGYAPENTMASFEKALSMNADGIELDVHITKDGHLIVCHDERVDRTTNGTGFIKELTLSEIRQLDAGSWFSEEFKCEKIPTLEEVFELIKHKDILLNIELKSGPIFYDGIEYQVIDMIKKYKMEDRIIVSSFNHYSLIEMKKIDKKIKTGILYMAGIVDPWVYAKRIEADAIHPLFYNINQRLIKGCKENGVLINPFTVNEEEYIIAMIISGVSGVITNYPDRAKRISEKL